MIDWAPYTFRLLIGAAALWLLKQMKNKATPIYKAIKKLSEVVNRVDALELKISIVDAKQLALIEMDPDPIFITDNESNVLYVNMSWLAMTGIRDVDHAKGKGYMQAIAIDYLPEFEKLVTRYLKHDSSFEGYIFFQHILTKEIIKTLCRSEPIYDVNKVLLGSIGRLLILK